MLPIAKLPELAPARLRGLLFDLDDTLLDHSKLSEAAYLRHLFRLHEAGFRAGTPSLGARQVGPR